MTIDHRIIALCGHPAYFDSNSGISFRCEVCGAVIGSIGMPTECHDVYKKKEMLETLMNRQISDEEFLKGLNR